MISPGPENEVLPGTCETLNRGVEADQPVSSRSSRSRRVAISVQEAHAGLTCRRRATRIASQDSCPTPGTSFRHSRSTSADPGCSAGFAPCRRPCGRSRSPHPRRSRSRTGSRARTHRRRGPAPTKILMPAPARSPTRTRTALRSRPARVSPVPPPGQAAGSAAAPRASPAPPAPDRAESASAADRIRRPSTRPGPRSARPVPTTSTGLREMPSGGLTWGES